MQTEEFVIKQKLKEQQIMSKINKTPEAASGAKRDALGIPYLRQVPLDAIASGACALEYGCERYGPRNWEKGLPWQQLIDSTRRHLDNIERRHHKDDCVGGSMLPEHCMFMASAMMLVASMIRGIGEDDRLPAPSISVASPKAIAEWMALELNAAQNLRKERVEALCVTVDVSHAE